MPSFENRNPFKPTDYRLADKSTESMRQAFAAKANQNPFPDPGLDPNSSNYVVTQAEKIAKDASNPQNTEFYNKAEGFEDFLNEASDRDYDFDTARFLLHASGVELKPDNSHSLQWENEPPVIVPAKSRNQNPGDPRLN